MAKIYSQVNIYNKLAKTMEYHSDIDFEMNRDDMRDSFTVIPNNISPQSVQTKSCELLKLSKI